MRPGTGVTHFATGAGAKKWLRSPLFGIHGPTLPGENSRGTESADIPKKLSMSIMWLLNEPTKWCVS